MKNDNEATAYAAKPSLGGSLLTQLLYVKPCYYHLFVDSKLLSRYDFGYGYFSKNSFTSSADSTGTDSYVVFKSEFLKLKTIIAKVVMVFFVKSK